MNYKDYEVYMSNQFNHGVMSNRTGVDSQIDEGLRAHM